MLVSDFPTVNYELLSQKEEKEKKHDSGKFFSFLKSKIFAFLEVDFCLFLNICS